MLSAAVLTGALRVNDNNKAYVFSLPSKTYSLKFTPSIFFFFKKVTVKKDGRQQRQSSSDEL